MVRVSTGIVFTSYGIGRNKLLNIRITLRAVPDTVIGR